MDILRGTAGIVLVVGLALAGGWLSTVAGGAIPGAVIGMALYLALLATGRFGWSLRGADVLTALIGAMIVPALVGLAAFADVLRPAAATVAVVLVLSTAITALVTAALFRLAGGRG